MTVQSKKVLIYGTMAYDHLMTFDGEFKDSLIEDKLSSLSVSFLTKDHQIYFGGTAGNIAYGMSQFGDTPLIYSFAGGDFRDYKNWLDENKISTYFIQIDHEKLTDAAYILTDKKQNQIAIFSASSGGGEQKVELYESDLYGIDYAVISPGLPDVMLELAQACAEFDIPFSFDPGQALPLLDKNSIFSILQGAKGMIVNSYEGDMIEEKTGKSLKELSSETGFIVKTLGPKGATIIRKSKNVSVPAIKKVKVLDPTGGGDAFRSAFLNRFMAGRSLEEACQYGNAAAALNIQKIGTQTYEPSIDKITQLVRKNYL